MLTVFVVILLLIIALLAIPVTLKFQVSRQQEFQGDITLLWLFGHVRVSIPVSESKAPSEKEKESELETSRSKSSSGRNSNAFAVIRQKSFRRRILRFVRDFWQAIDKENVRLRVRLGLGDPADTGQLWAIVGPLAAVLATVQDALIEIEPEFLDACFEMNSSGMIRMMPIQMLYLAFGLLLSPSIWQGIKQMRAVA